MATLTNSPQYQKAVTDYQRVKAAKAHGIAPQWANAKAMLGTYAFWGNVEGVKQALIQGADFELNDEQRWGPVSGAGYRRYIEITQLMLDRGMDINKVEKGKTLLANASYNGPGQPAGDQQFAYIKWLLEKGANPNIPDSAGQKPVDIAVGTQADQRVVELLKANTKD
ncbi:ankyrin repeat domain-containing protein [Mesorhizobium sp. B2-7-1]|uniref:ankyrin repeat domain-containing protein n=1 Tax=Mesorhizobium sp. B2-7-1 TaxID=2589909 RepID=UPI00112CCAB8|nr:ankyrin repeat domain-containing protein [Mesorhizobium sp. B2-7-1]TPJ66270.1 ankyrin repeat domain-containing protein [Mesorhizobium sp. B2-7-1]